MSGPTLEVYLEKMVVTTDKQLAAATKNVPTKAKSVLAQAAHAKAPSPTPTAVVGQAKGEARAVLELVEESGGRVLRPPATVGNLLSQEATRELVEAVESALRARDELTDELKLFADLGRDTLVQLLLTAATSQFPLLEGPRAVLQAGSFGGYESTLVGLISEQAALRHPQALALIKEKVEEVKANYPDWDPRPLLILGSEAPKEGGKPTSPYAAYVDVLVVFPGKVGGSFEGHHCIGVALEIKTGNVADAVYERVKGSTEWRPGQIERIETRSIGRLKVANTVMIDVHLLPPGDPTIARLYIPEATYALIGGRALTTAEVAHFDRAHLRVSSMVSPHSPATIRRLARMLLLRMPR